MMASSSFLALSIAVALTSPTALAEQCEATSEGGCRSSLLQAELEQEEVATDYRFELLQRDVKRSEAIKTAEKPTPGTPVALAALVGPTPRPVVEAADFDCEKYPLYCDQRLDCASVTADIRFKWNIKFTTDDGRPNLQSWCQAYPKFQASLPACLFENDLSTYSKYMYEEQASKGIDKTDGLYCFSAGHCSNTKVTLDTTKEEAEEMCNELYGDEWKSVGIDNFGGAIIRGSSTDKEAASSGKLSPQQIVNMTRRETTVFAMAACAMGNFHCDVIYCKENYCNNPAYAHNAWAALPR